MFNAAIQAAYTLGPYVCVDEMMIPFKGWSCIRTYATALQISFLYSAGHLVGYPKFRTLDE